MRVCTDSNNSVASLTAPDLGGFVVLGFILAAVCVDVPADKGDEAQAVGDEFVVEDGGVGFKLDQLNCDGRHPCCVGGVKDRTHTSKRGVVFGAPIMARRRALAMLASVPDRTNSQYSSLSWRICTCGSRRGGAAPGTFMIA